MNDGQAQASAPSMPAKTQQEPRLRLAALAARIPLRWRLALVMFGLLAVLLLGLGALVSATVENALLSNQAVALHDVARFALNGPQSGAGHNGPGIIGPDLSLVDAGETPPAIGVPSDQILNAADMITRRLSGPGTGVALLSTTGAIISQDISEVPDLSPNVTLTSAQLQTALTAVQSDQDYVLANDASGQRQIVVVLPVVEHNQTVAALQLSSPTKAIDASVALTRTILFSGIGASLALAALLAVPLMRLTLRPLEEMERVSHKIAAGDLTLRLNEPPADDEIGRVSRSFNAMVARLEGMLTRQQRFMADVSHELRTPLTALAGGIEMMLLGAHTSDPAAGARLLRSMYAETERMRRLVEELLTLARLDEGRLTLRIESVDATALVAALCEDARPLVRGQTLRCEAPSESLPVRADADRLKQALLILLDNALKFTPEGGEVTLSVKREERAPFAVFQVADTGIGITPEDIPHIFERFYRVDPARTRSQQRGGGSGLGLAIAKSLVEAHEGTISLTSAPNVGTTVIVRLPLWREQPPTQPAIVAPQPEAQPETQPAS